LGTVSLAGTIGNDTAAVGRRVLRSRLCDRCCPSYSSTPLPLHLRIGDGAKGRAILLSDDPGSPDPLRGESTALNRGVHCASCHPMPLGTFRYRKELRHSLASRRVGRADLRGVRAL